MVEFEVVKPLVGGILIGLSAAILMLAKGRIAGISGIVEGVLKPTQGDIFWRVIFLFGLIVGGLTMSLFIPENFDFSTNRSLELIALSGLLVGLGVHVGCGCTSGHGICGISQISVRSLVAVPTFMTAGALVVWFLN